MKIHSFLRSNRLLLVAFSAVFLFAPYSVSAQELIAPTTLPPVVEKIDGVKADVNNFARVSDGIWRGAVPSTEALEHMSKSGIKTVIDLRMTGIGTIKESATSQRLGMKYIHIPMGFTAPNNDQVSQFLKIVTTPADLPVFVHCTQGADRTGTLVGIYRRLVQGWTFDRTYEEMKTHHFKPFLFGMKDLVKTCDQQKFAGLPGTSTVVAQDPTAGTVLVTP